MLARPTLSKLYGSPILIRDQQRSMVCAPDGGDRHCISCHYEWSSHTDGVINVIATDAIANAVNAIANVICAIINVAHRNADVTNRTDLVTGAIANERGAIANVIDIINNATHDNTNVTHHTTGAKDV